MEMPKPSTLTLGKPQDRNRAKAEASSRRIVIFVKTTKQTSGSPCFFVARRTDFVPSLFACKISIRTSSVPYEQPGGLRSVGRQ